MRGDCWHFSVGPGRKPPRITELTLSNDSLAGLRLLFVTDIHMNRLFTEGHLEALLGQMEQQSPDLILWGGDFAETPELQRRFFQLVKRLRPPLGSFAVLGNNDVENATPQQLRKMAREAGIRLLVNESVRVKTTQSNLFIIGLDEPKHGTPDLALPNAPAESDEFRILLVHSPLALRAMGANPANPPDLILTGHTHGGQISLFGLTPYHFGYERALFQKHFFVSGQHSVGHSLLLVSNGIGSSTLPLRIGTPPELHLIIFSPRSCMKELD